MTQDVHQKTDVRSDNDLPLSDPDELFTGKPLPTRDWIFKTNDGQKKKIRIQGLTYGEKRIEDIRASREREEADGKGDIESDLRMCRILAKAVRTVDGRRRYTTDEEQVVAAFKFNDQMADGEVVRAYNGVMQLSGYSKEDEALNEAGKS